MHRRTPDEWIRAVLSLPGEWIGQLFGPRAFSNQKSCNGTQATATNNPPCPGLGSDGDVRYMILLQAPIGAGSRAFSPSARALSFPSAAGLSEWRAGLAVPGV